MAGACACTSTISDARRNEQYSMIQTPRVELCFLGNNIYLFCLDFFWNFQPIYIGLTFSKLSEVEQNFQQIVRSRTQRYGPRDARPDRSTPDLSRPCEVDAGFRVCRPRRCLLCARRFSAGSARFDGGPCYAPSMMRALVVAPEKRKIGI